MLYLALAASFGWVATTCLFAYVLLRITDRHSRQVQTLLNRIQKPDLAVAQSIADPDAYKEQIYVPFDDDAAHWAYREERET